MSKIQTTEYKAFIKKIKIKAQQAQIKASVRVNSILLEFYWELGGEIVEKQKSANWGSAFLENMSQDLMHEFPNMKGFSKRNLELIRKWYLYYSEKNEITKQAVSQLLLIPCIGILLCKGKDKTLVEYALSDIHKPMGVSEYELTHILPKELESSLPSIEEIEEELNCMKDKIN